MNIVHIAGAAAILALVTTGCRSTRHAVIAATGTTIGVEFAQAPGDGAPEAKLGYHRGELAIVPTNRSAAEDPNSHGGGAKDVTDVIMELRYQDIFSDKAGIYQRLAVGSKAVVQPGAAFMFARGADGEGLDAQTADAIAKALDSVPDADTSADLGDLSRGYARADDAVRVEYDSAAFEFGHRPDDDIGGPFQVFLMSGPDDDAVAAMVAELARRMAQMDADG